MVMPTTAISGGSQRKGITTWHFLRNFECGASWTAVAFYLPPKVELFFGLWAGRSPARAPRSGAGGGTPPPQRILPSCWAGEGLWACQKGQIGQKMVRFGQLGAARSRQDELIERRPKEQQGTQDAHKKQMRGCGYSLLWQLNPPPI
jgi:hypothetical protein